MDHTSYAMLIKALIALLPISNNRFLFIEVGFYFADVIIIFFFQAAHPIKPQNPSLFCS